MENFKFKTEAGQCVVLSEMDMQKVHNHYVLQNTADYVRENNPDLDESDVQIIASNARLRMDKYDEDEELAVKNARYNALFPLEKRPVQ